MISTEFNTYEFMDGNSKVDIRVMHQGVGVLILRHTGENNETQTAHIEVHFIYNTM